MSPAAFSFAHPAEVHMHYLNSADLSVVNLLQHYSSEQKKNMDCHASLATRYRLLRQCERSVTIHIHAELLQ
jgi:ferritin